MFDGAAANVATHPIGGARSRRRDYFFLISATVMSLIVFAGFAPSFFLRPMFSDTPLPAYLIVHGVVMALWQLLFLVQTVLAARWRADLHRRVGISGAILAVAVVVTGMQANLNVPARVALTGGQFPFPVEALVIGNIFGFALFAGLVTTALVYRKNLALHRRLMFWSCLVIIGPAITPSRTFGSIIAPAFPQTFPPEIALIWMGWLALLAYDWRSLGRFHPATICCGFLTLLVVPALLDWILLSDGVLAWAKDLA